MTRKAWVSHARGPGGRGPCRAPWKARGSGGVAVSAGVGKGLSGLEGTPTAPGLQPLTCPAPEAGVPELVSPEERTLSAEGWRHRRLLGCQVVRRVNWGPGTKEPKRQESPRRERTQALPTLLGPQFPCQGGHSDILVLEVAPFLGSQPLHLPDLPTSLS